MKTIYYLSPGHGGLYEDVYLTKGKQSPFVPPGIYEGEFNRAISKRLVGLLTDNGFCAVDLSPSPVDVPLTSRTTYANAHLAASVLKNKTTQGRYIAIHANAAPGGDKRWVDADGFVVFYLLGARSQPLASCVESEMKSGLRGVIDSRGVKTSFFQEVKQPAMPSVLIECGFMTNQAEAIKLATESVRDLIARSIYNGLMKERVS